MKNNHPYEYAFARTIDGKFDKAQGSYLKKAPTQTIPKYKSESPFLFGVAQVPLDDGIMIGRLGGVCDGRNFAHEEGTKQESMGKKRRQGRRQNLEE
eukprot:8752922-Ditylum_brightwellii.AAC.1